MISSFVSYARQHGLDFNELPLSHPFPKRRKIETGCRFMGIYQCGHSLVVFRSTDRVSDNPPNVIATVLDDVQVRTDVQSGGWHTPLPSGQDQTGEQDKIIAHLKQRNALLSLELDLTRANPFHDTPNGLTVKPGPNGQWIVILNRRMTVKQWESASVHLPGVVVKDVNGQKQVICKITVECDAVTALVSILK